MCPLPWKSWQREAIFNALMPLSTYCVSPISFSHCSLFHLPGSFLAFVVSMIPSYLMMLGIGSAPRRISRSYVNTWFTKLMDCEFKSWCGSALRRIQRCKSCWKLVRRSVLNSFMFWKICKIRTFQICKICTFVQECLDYMILMFVLIENLASIFFVTLLCTISIFYWLR